VNEASLLTASIHNDGDNSSLPPSPSTLHQQLSRLDDVTTATATPGLDEHVTTHLAHADHFSTGLFTLPV